MRTYNHLYENTAILQDFLRGISVQKSDAVLVRIHSALHTRDEMPHIIGEIKNIIPSAQIIGCSTTQTIYEGRLIPHSCLVSVSVFENADTVTGRLSCIGENSEMRTGSDLAKELLNKIGRDAAKGFLLIFFPVTYSKIEEFVEGINKSDAELKMLGGAACLDAEDEHLSNDVAYVIEADTTSASDAAFAYITAEKMHLYGDYVCGVEPVGKRNRIKCHGCYIDEVDNMSGAEWYENMLGADGLQKDPSLAHIFPLVKRDERGIAYYVDYILSASDEHGRPLFRLKSYGELKSGSNVSIGYFHPNNIFEQVRDLLENVSQSPAESVFGYDCNSRMELLHNCAKWEIENFNTTNISGALLAGEISFRNGENLYANYTFVVALLSEHEDAHFVLDAPDVRKVQELQEDNVQMLNYMLVNANRRLSDEFMAQQTKMKEAVFYNASLGVDNQLKYRYDKEREGLNKTAIFGLNNEKMLKLFSGTTETYIFLKDCYRKVRRKFRVDGLFMYSYNDTSLFIAANDLISSEQFIKIVDDIHDFVNNSVYGEIKLSYTTVLLFGAEDSMQRLETALRYARNHKLEKIRFDEIGDDLKEEQEDIKLLWIVREALLHRRVVPHFQEIHNNTGTGRKIYESLMRVIDANGKIYYPDRFLPVAKEYDLYESLSEMMVKTVIDMFRDKDAIVSINLNVQDIYNRNILKLIFESMQEVAHPENFVFEIVESEEIKDYEYIKGFADRIHEYGGKIAIDDFGSGFSNILHVLRIDADYIKIDGNIVRTMPEEPRCRDFIEFMNGWCKRMGKQLICEYVENEEIQQIMKDIGVAYSQGYYFSKPHEWDENKQVS
jgi:EAL domain-containing protein (putative c-di-GMP-specific phosphodiesterase class I)